MPYLLIDTDILIDIANNDATAQARLVLESQKATLAISCLTVMELMVGCRNKSELQTLNRFLARFHIFDLQAAIGHRAVDLVQRYFLSHGMLIADSLIASTAIEHNIPLLSKNQRDFRFIDELDLLPYP
jgi:predicted nucleic acid-binding protein